MRWGNERESDNVEDRSGSDSGGGGGMSFPSGPVIGGIGGIGLVAVVLLGMLFGVDPREILNDVSTTQTQAPRTAPAPQASRPAPPEQKKFVSVILASTEDVWGETFKQMGRTYQPPKLVLYSRSVQSACGMSSSAMGPFYCPGDRKVYLDLTFFADMQQKLGVTGEFARAYVIAHEVGHHVQNLLGISRKTQQLQQQAASRAEKNRLSVLLELQADCYAGVWAKRADQSRHILEPGDIEKGLNAASAIGDDRIQKRTQGYVVPDSFTHGSSVHRVYWFKRGFEAGKHTACDTFTVYQNQATNGAK
jgi:predicted metalloprotease